MNFSQTTMRWNIYIYIYIFVYQCNPDIREFSGQYKTYLISKFLLYPGSIHFVYINTGSNLGPEKIYLISGFLLYSGLLYPSYTAHTYIYIYIYIYHIVPSARISLVLSCHPSLSFIASGRSSGLLLVSSQSCCM